MITENKSNQIKDISLISAKISTDFPTLRLRPTKCSHDMPRVKKTRFRMMPRDPKYLISPFNSRWFEFFAVNIFKIFEVFSRYLGANCGGIKIQLSK